MLKGLQLSSSLSRKVLVGNLQNHNRIYSTIVSHSNATKFKKYVPVLSGLLVGYGLFRYKTDVNCSEHETDGKKWILYQYATCPFCNKVRAFLDFYGLDYEIVEVNPLLRKEIKFSDYRKVPILIKGDQQLNDSSLIISVLKSHLIGRGEVDELLPYYPALESKNGRKKSIEYQNRYYVMYQQGFDKEKNASLRYNPYDIPRGWDVISKEETKWRRWVDDTFVHTLSPNIYRTMDESFKAMEYITSVGNFSSFERSLVYYTGAVAMYIIGKRVKNRHRLRNDVRESMYMEARLWTKAVGKKRKFLGGNLPNLADLNMYGVLHAIEDLDAFNDLLKNTEIGPWYYRMKKQVESHAGANNEDWLLGKIKS